MRTVRGIFRAEKTIGKFQETGYFVFTHYVMPSKAKTAHFKFFHSSVIRFFLLPHLRSPTRYNLKSGTERLIIEVEIMFFSYPSRLRSITYRIFVR